MAIFTWKHSIMYIKTKPTNCDYIIICFFAIICTLIERGIPAKKKSYGQFEINVKKCQKPITGIKWFNVNDNFFSNTSAMLLTSAYSFSSPYFNIFRIDFFLVKKRHIHIAIFLLLNILNTSFKNFVQIHCPEIRAFVYLFFLATSFILHLPHITMIR